MAGWVYLCGSIISLAAVALALQGTLPQIAPAAEKKLLKPGQSTTILVSITPRKGDRLLSGYISILTDSPVKPEITVPVYGSPVN